MKISKAHWSTQDNKRMDLSNLHCPECGSIYLHQTNVAVYNRDEDKEYGLHVEVTSSSCNMDKVLTGNPSPRRQGLSIVFFCEECNDDSPNNVKGIDHPGHILNIFQHKGETFIGWEGKYE